MTRRRPPLAQSARPRPSPWKRFKRLFAVKTKFEAFLVIYALATGAVERGFNYVHHLPGTSGWLMFAACTGVVFIAGGKILDAVERDEHDRDTGLDML
ncbi:hypothetical protein [Sphingomonas yunnanensis]|uniref:hypothetical protein n=1 Tax=Sphingomonas yunnanensis TaxID=310400 RepID=UPI0031BA77F6